MPRSSFSDNPLLRVSRPVSACSRCRAAKVKCDGKLPACTACEKAGRENECSAANDQFARGKERSYVAALELRIEKLERRLAYARSRKASVASHANEAPPVFEPERKDSLATIRAAIHRKAARNRENSDVNSLISDFGYLSVNATTRDFEPSTSNMTFARLVLAATTGDPLPSAPPARLPPRQAATALIQYYLTHVYALYPFFPETTLLSVVDAAYQQDQPSLRSSDQWLLYMVLAIGSSAQSQGTEDEYYRNGVQFVTRALDYADRVLAPGYVSQVQSLLLLTQYSMLDPAHFDAWHLIGITCRAAVDLGYHQDPPLSAQGDKTQLDMRRKTFYCAYALDRAISMVHARAFSFTDDAINVAFPSMVGIGRIPSASGPIKGPQSANPAILLFQLRRCQSHWYQLLYESDPSDPLPDAPSYIWQMCHEMREWNEALPETLPIGIRELFDLELKYSYVYCITPSPRAPHPTAYGRMLIFEYVLAYVDRVFELAHGPANPALYTYHDALRVFFMGSQLLSVLRDAADALLAPGAAAVPAPPARPGQAPPPPMPARSPGDNAARAARALDRVGACLARYGARWADADHIARGWGALSAEVAAGLSLRVAAARGFAAQQQLHQQQHGRSPPVPGVAHGMLPAPGAAHSPPGVLGGGVAGVGHGGPSRSPPVVMGAPAMMGPGQGLGGGGGHGMMAPPPVGMMGQQQQQQQQQEEEVKWVDMDITQMMRQNGM